ncbi:MAG: hypothetical protein WCY10_00705 [Candidatus Omnitrophota bacterium]
MNKNLRITIQVILFSLSCFIYSCFANPSLKEFQIPSQFGTIKEVFEPQNAVQRSPAIIQIQDAHCNYEAQKNLAQILDFLVKEKKLRLVMVEGGTGDVSLSFLRSFADKKTREEIADKYLREGKIAGEEYLDIVSDHNLELYGIEDPDLYDNNLDSFLNIEGYKEQGRKDTDNLKAVVDALKPLVYNRDLLRLEEKKKALDQKTMSLAEYCAYLSQVASGKGIPVDAYPQLRAFQESLAFEKTIDFKQADAQRAAVIKDLAKKLEGAAVKQLIAKTQDLKDKKMSPADYYDFLQSQVKDKIDLKKEYPQFEAYMRYVSSGRLIKAEELIQEISLLESAARESLFVNNDERRLSAIARSLDIIIRFLQLDLTPAEYAALQADRSDYLPSSWVNFLSDSCRRYNIAVRPSITGVIDDNFDKLDSFYKVGIDREAAFLKNIKQKIGAGRDNVVVVITGGFHTAGLSKLFQKEGYAYAVVTPAITKKSDPEIYFSVLRAETDRDEDVAESD